jgi:hypothetical protein
MLAGVVALIYFAVRNPSRIADTGRVFLDEPEGEPQPAPRRTVPVER